MMRFSLLAVVVVTLPRRVDRPRPRRNRRRQERNQCEQEYGSAQEHDWSIPTCVDPLIMEM